MFYKCRALKRVLDKIRYGLNSYLGYVGSSLIYCLKCVIFHAILGNRCFTEYVGLLGYVGLFGVCSWYYLYKVYAVSLQCAYCVLAVSSLCSYCGYAVGLLCSYCVYTKSYLYKCTVCLH